MSTFKPIETKDMTQNPFELIGKDWMLITAKKDDKVNTMTASWGGVGVLWGQDVVYIFVRQSRYTKEFIDSSNEFSLTFFDPSQYRKELSYLGKVSGRTEDKIAKVGLTTAEEDGIPFFEEANMAILCKKVGQYYIDPKGILDETVIPKWYADNNYHDMYIGKIEKVLKKVESV